MTPDRRALLDQLVRHEGVRLRPYTDQAGKTSIGVGRNLTDAGISREEAMTLLDHDVDEAITDLAAAYPWFAYLDSVRQRAVVDLRFNTGAQGFRTFHEFLRAMALKDYPSAAYQLRASAWAGEVGRRARDLSVMIETGKEPA